MYPTSTPATLTFVFTSKPFTFLNAAYKVYVGFFLKENFPICVVNHPRITSIANIKTPTITSTFLLLIVLSYIITL